MGFTHPNKIYGAMFMGKPILYIGPFPSHVTDILKGLKGNIAVEHTHWRELVEKLISFKSNSENELTLIGEANRSKAKEEFNSELLKSRMVDILTSSN